MLGSQQQLAEASGASPQAVSFWVAGERTISPAYALRVEKATDGKVTRYDLRPDIFGTAPTLIPKQRETANG